jgi:hypothetical protein
MNRRISGVLVAGMALLVPTLASAWAAEANFSARVHKHEFSRVTLNAAGCTAKVRVFFDAPEEAYKDDVPARNYYRFHARIKLDSGHQVVTRVFHNDGPGARIYDYEQDTTADGCWAKSDSHAQGVDVEGCRGRGCTPEPFK